MDACEATKVVMSRIKDLDPENASKILGHILLQGQGEKEVIRLAFAPEPLLLSCINQAKTFLGIPPTSPSSGTSNVTKTSPRMLNALHLNNPSSPAPSFSRTGSRPISYAGALTGSVEDEFLGGGFVDPLQLQVYSPIASPSGRNESLVFPYSDDLSTLSPSQLHRVNPVKDVGFLELGCRPCMYFSRGGCKNGDSCRFSHNEIGLDIADSPGCDEFMRFKALHQEHRLPSLIASGGQHHFPFKPADLHDDNQRNDLLSTGIPSSGTSSSSRQIYLTFPADSTFKEEDVAAYFSNFGPVQDVRIPYQQRRMFGFVTFLYPETVKSILAKGNPHFIRDCRVLVKPYKDKGKMPERKLMYQQMERGEFSSGVGSSVTDSIEQLDIPFGPRMLLNVQEKMLQRKIEEQAELRNSIEIQGQRMMNMQLADWHYQSYDSDSPSSLSTGMPLVSSRQGGFPMQQTSAIGPSETITQSTFEEFHGSQLSQEPRMATHSNEYIASNATDFYSNDANQNASDADQSPK